MQNFNDEEQDIISSINVTPLVDIMLVLLIIFMLVSTFVDFSSIEVELPHAATGEQIKTESISVLIAENGDYFFSGKKVESYDILVETLKKKKAENPDIQVLISADRKVYHERVVKVIDTIRKLGISKFAINVEPLEDEEN